MPEARDPYGVFQDEPPVAPPRKMYKIHSMAGGEMALQDLLSRIVRGDTDDIRSRPRPPMPPAPMPPEEDIRAIPGVFPPRR